MPAIKITYDSFAGILIRKITLDGVEQEGVIEVDPAAGYIVRGKRLPESDEAPDGFVCVGHRRFLFDKSSEEFVYERVDGVVGLTWLVPELGAEVLKLLEAS